MINSEEIKERFEKRKKFNNRYSILQPWTVRSEQEKERYFIKWVTSQKIAPVEDKKLLEIGCGTGNNLMHFIRIGFMPQNLYGNELLEERFDLLKKKLPGVNHLDGDALKLDVKKNSMDIIFQSLVFSSVPDEYFRKELAAKMWEWTLPGGGILWYDFIYNHPSNKDVKGVPFEKIKEYFPNAEIIKWKITLAPPLARVICKIHPSLYNLFRAFPFLRTHLLCWIKKPNYE